MSVGAAADVEIYAEDGDLIDSRLPSQLAAADGVERVFGRRVIFGTEADCGAVPSVKQVDLYSFDTFDLEALKKDGLLERGCDLEAVVSGGAAFVISDEDIEKGSTVTAFATSLPVAGRLKYDPFSSDGSTERRTSLIVSDKTFRDTTGVADYTMLIVRLSGAATDEQAAALKALTGDRYRWIDNRENDTHGTYTAFLVCVYSFLVVIALVTILNVVNSISMSVSARVRQYGAMRAVGMSQKQLARMVTAEALTYASLGCAAGLAIGLAFSKWLYGFLVTSHYPYAQWHLPTVQLMIIAGFFALSVAAGIRKPIRRLKQMSITETIGQL